MSGPDMHDEKAYPKTEQAGKREPTAPAQSIPLKALALATMATVHAKFFSSVWTVQSKTEKHNAGGKVQQQKKWLTSHIGSFIRRFIGHTNLEHEDGPQLRPGDALFRKEVNHSQGSWAPRHQMVTGYGANVASTTAIRRSFHEKSDAFGFLHGPCRVLFVHIFAGGRKAQKFGVDKRSDVAQRIKFKPSDEKIRWKMVMPWSKGLLFYDIAAHFCDSVRLASAGRLDIKPFSAGELVPAMQTLDAVSQGSAQAGHDWPGYWKGKNEAFVAFASVPFGLDGEGYNI